MSKNGIDQSRKVMIVAGEASGDLHGSHLIKAASEHYPHLHFFGVGGEKMASAGCRIIFSANELSVMGVTEVLGRLPVIYKRFRELKQLLHSEERPDLLILIDFPDFNLRLAKAAAKIGVKVLYYISPKVWAWRSGRAKTIAERVDRLALIFPFEPQIYEKLGVKADYVGNPLLDEFVENRPQGCLRTELGIASGEQIVGIFPGSRNSEIEYILGTLIDTAALIRREKPAVKFLLPVAPSLSRETIEAKFLAADIPVTFVENNIYEVAAACNAILTVSGTVTLQITLVGTPMAIVYKVAPLSYTIGKRLIKIEFAGLTNIIAGREVVREFIQDKADPAAMCCEVLRLLDDRSYNERIKADLAEVKALLGQPGCSARVADIVAEMTDTSVK